jgi:hypothetical protein
MDLEPTFNAQGIYTNGFSVISILPPSDVIWENMNIKPHGRMIRRFIILRLSSSFGLFLSSLSKLLPTLIDTFAKALSFLAPNKNLPPTAVGIIQGILPAVTLAYFNCFGSYHNCSSFHYGRLFLNSPLFNYLCFTFFFQLIVVDAQKKKNHRINIKIGAKNLLCHRTTIIV